MSIEISCSCDKPEMEAQENGSYKCKNCCRTKTAKDIEREILLEKKKRAVFYRSLTLH